MRHGIYIQHTQSYTPTFSEWFTPILVGWCSIFHHHCSLNEQHLFCSGGDHYRGHAFVEDIPITIVGIEQNSLINGPTNRSCDGTASMLYSLVLGIFTFCSLPTDLYPISCFIMMALLICTSILWMAAGDLYNNLQILYKDNAYSCTHLYNYISTAWSFCVLAASLRC